MYTHILMCFDGSDVAHAALAHAIDLAQDQGARLRIVHVMERPGIFWPNLTPEQETELMNLQRDQGEALLRRAERQAVQAGVNATTTLLNAGISEASIAEVIAAQAKTAAADLVIVGSHGRSGVSRLFLGSVAARVAQVCPAPVLIVHERKPAP